MTPFAPKLQGAAKPAGCRPCPLYSKGRGFCLGWGDPETAQLAVLAETPASHEIAYNLQTPARFPNMAVDEQLTELNRQEIWRRMKSYSQLNLRIISRGVPLVGKTGAFWSWRVLKPMGIDPHSLFRDNTLRCWPPKRGDSNYPIGEERLQAEKCCRQYDRFDLFCPDLAVVAFHPASLLGSREGGKGGRDITPLYLLSAAVKKARDFVDLGHRVVLLLGGKATKAWLGYGEQVTRYNGHYAWSREMATRFQEDGDDDA